MPDRAPDLAKVRHRAVSACHVVHDGDGLRHWHVRETTATRVDNDGAVRTTTVDPRDLPDWGETVQLLDPVDLCVHPFEHDYDAIGLRIAVSSRSTLVGDDDGSLVLRSGRACELVRADAVGHTTGTVYLTAAGHEVDDPHAECPLPVGLPDPAQTWASVRELTLGLGRDAASVGVRPPRALPVVTAEQQVVLASDATASRLRIVATEEEHQACGYRPFGRNARTGLPLDGYSVWRPSRPAAALDPTLGCLVSMDPLGANETGPTRSLVIWGEPSRRWAAWVGVDIPSATLAVPLSTARFTSTSRASKMWLIGSDQEVRICR